MATYAYIRVSHAESALSGLSAAAQQKAILSYAAARNWTDWSHHKYPDYELPGFFVDLAVSAWKVPLADRPAGMFLNAVVKEGDRVIMYAIDRGFRSTLDFAKVMRDWCDRGVGIACIRQSINLTTANGKLMARMFANWAEYQSDMRSERGRQASMLWRETGDKPSRKKRTQRGAVRIPAGLVLPEKPACATETASGVVYSYARISHASRLDGCSEEAQRLQCDMAAEWLVENTPDLTRGEHFFDGAVSAFKIPFFKRPQARLLCQKLQPGDRIVFTRLDRAWRSVHDMLDTWQVWERQGVNIHFCDTDLDSSTPAGRMMLQIYAVFAEWESADQSARTKAAFERARAEGRYVKSRLPLGMHVNNGRLEFTVSSMPAFAWCYWALKKLGPSAASDYIEEIAAKRENRKPITRGGFYLGTPREKRRVLGPKKVKAYADNIHIAEQACLRSRASPLATAFLLLKQAIDMGVGHPAMLFPHPYKLDGRDAGQIVKEFGKNGQCRLDFRQGLPSVSVGGSTPAT